LREKVPEGQMRGIAPDRDPSSDGFAATFSLKGRRKKRASPIRLGKG
jgi:hypothetical protein